jgi:hypothetical protein
MQLPPKAKIHPAEAARANRSSVISHLIQQLNRFSEAPILQESCNENSPRHIKKGITDVKYELLKVKEGWS